MRKSLAVLPLTVALVLLGGCSDNDDSAEPAYDDEQAEVIDDYVAAFNAKDIDGVMATMTPEDNRVPDAVVKCEHEVFFEQADLLLDVDTDTAIFEFTDAEGEVVDSGGVRFTFADDGLLDGSTLALEVGLDYGLDYSQCDPRE